MMKLTAIRKPCDGFTLMELLLVIAIMGVLTTMALAMLRSANEQARVSATQARITRIEAILDAEFERYEVRRLPISRQTLLNYINANPWTSVVPPVPTNVRLEMLQKRIRQDLINCEMPRPEFNGTDFERNRDLGFFPSRVPPIGGAESFWEWLNAKYPTPSSSSLRSALNMEPPYTMPPSNPPSGTIASWSAARLADRNFKDPAEYLYEILTRIDLDGVPALETLGSTSFGDSDNDGFLEVVDAWGEPLLWLIVQVDVKNPLIDPTTDGEVFEDVDEVDWTKRLANGMPVGYTLLDSTIPRDLQQIRLTVYSKRLNDQGIYNTN